MGAGPAGLASAIELARLVRSDAEPGDELGEVEVSVLEKGELREVKRPLELKVHNTVRDLACLLSTLKGICESTD